MSQSKALATSSAASGTPPAGGVALPGCVVRQSLDLTFPEPPPELVRLTGYDAERLSLSPPVFWELVHEEDRPALQARLLTMAESPEELWSAFRIRPRGSGQIRHLLEHRRLLRDSGQAGRAFELVWVDQTGHFRALRRLHAATWDGAISRMAAGMVHELNNALTGLVSFSELASRKAGPGHPLHEYLTVIHQNGRRACQLTADFGSVFRRLGGGMGWVDLRDSVSEMMRLWRLALPRRLEVLGNASEDPLPVAVDPMRLRESLVQLGLNAAEAVDGPGRITVEAMRRDPPWEARVVLGELPPAPWACLAVSDTGCGLTPAQVAKFSEPGHATRPGSWGYGVGLAVVRQFLVDHGGALLVEGAPGQGTRVTLCLPLVSFEEQTPQVEPETRPCLRALVAGQHAEIRAELVFALRDGGWHVVEAVGEIETVLAAQEEPFAGVVWIQDPTEPVPRIRRHLGTGPSRSKLAVIRARPSSAPSPGGNWGADLVIDWATQPKAEVCRQVLSALQPEP